MIEALHVVALCQFNSSSPKGFNVTLVYNNNLSHHLYCILYPVHIRYCTVLYIFGLRARAEFIWYILNTKTK